MEAYVIVMPLPFQGMAALDSSTSTSFTTTSKTAVTESYLLGDVCLEILNTFSTEPTFRGHFIPGQHTYKHHQFVLWLPWTYYQLIMICRISAGEMRGIAMLRVVK